MAKRKLGSVKLTDDVLITAVDLASDITGTLTVPNGGTGATTLTGLVIGNGAGAMTGLAPGAAGGLVRSDGASWLRVSGLAYTDLTYSGLTIGHVLRATGAAAASFGTLDTAGITNAAVTYAKIQNIGSLSVFGRSTNSAGVGADITGADGQVLRVSGTTLGFGTIATAGLADASVTYAKIQDAAALSVLGRAANSVGDLADIVAATDHQVLRRSGTAIAFGAVNLAQTAAVTGTLGAANGGTGLATSGTAGNVLTSDGVGGWVSSAVASEAGLAYVEFAAAGAESANAIEVPGDVKAPDGVNIAVATAEVEVLVSDSATDAEPSATATIAAAAVPVGTLLAGSGTATVHMRCNATGDFTVKVSETAAASRFLWVRQGRNSQFWIRANATPKQITFT